MENFDADSEGLPQPAVAAERHDGFGSEDDDDDIAGPAENTPQQHHHQRQQHHQQSPPRQLVNPAHFGPMPQEPRDSEAYEVKYLGRLPISATRQQPPDGRTCAIAVTHLAKLRSRKKYRYGAAKNVELIISARRGGVLCKPTHDDPGHRMKVSLTEITCVADHEHYVCFVTGRLRQDGSLVCWAHAFDCESPIASRILAEEIVHACRFAFARMRRASAELAAQRAARAAQAAERAAAVAAEAAATAATAAAEATAEASKMSTNQSKGVTAGPQHRNDNKKKAAAKDREPNASDKLVYHDAGLLDKVVSYQKRSRVKEPEVDRGNGKWYRCCQNLGCCRCNEVTRWPPENLSEPSTPETKNINKSNSSKMHGLSVGDNVFVQVYGMGTIRYLGPNKSTDENGTLMCGIELEKNSGNCDGSLDGNQYFECKAKFGLVFPLGKYPMTLRGPKVSQ